jgi:hypothetical protein
MSVASNASSIVSFRGEEIDVNDALDTLFRDLQEKLNYCHSTVRTLVMSEDRDESYVETAAHVWEIEDYTDLLDELFGELRTVSKEILGKCPADEKDEFKKVSDKRKEDKKRAKEEAKKSLIVIKE